MRPGQTNQSAHAAPLGRTGKKGRQTCVAGYCARCKSCLLFNKKTLIRPLHSFGVAGVLHVYWMVMQIQGAGLGKVGFIFGIKIVENVKYCTA